MAEKVLPPPSEQSRPWPCAGPRAAERESWQSLEAHLPEDPSNAWMSLLKLQLTLTLLMCCTTASKYGYIGQRMDIPIPCTFSITDCIKLIMVANPILSGAL